MFIGIHFSNHACGWIIFYIFKWITGILGHTLITNFWNFYNEIYLRDWDIWINVFFCSYIQLTICFKRQSYIIIISHHVNWKALLLDTKSNLMIFYIKNNNCWLLVKKCIKFIK